MEARDILVTAFDAELTRVFGKNQDILSFLISHERKDACINNLLKEIRSIELGRAVKLDKPRIEMIGADFARTFGKLSLNYQERKAMTELQKDIEQKKADEFAEFESFFEEEVQVTDSSKEL